MKSPEEILARTPLFEKLSQEERVEIVAACRHVGYDRGETINNDDGIEWFNILLSGRVKLMQTDPVSGRTFVTFLLERGDVFDLISLLDGEPHVTLPIVVEPTTLLRVPMMKAQSWLELYPEFDRALLPYMSGKMRELEGFAESMIFDDTATRLAKIILRHARPMEDDERVLSIQGVSHELLAEMIGSVRSVVTTQLKKLREEGHIIHSRGRIIIKDLEGILQRYHL